MAMGVLLRRNHRRVAANMTELSAGLPVCRSAWLPCLSPCRSSLSLTARLEMSRGGGGLVVCWVGPRKGICDLGTQTGGQKMERNKSTGCPTWSIKAHDTGEMSLQYAICRVTSKVDGFEVVPAHAPAVPRNCLHLHLQLQLVLQLYCTSVPWASASEQSRHFAGGRHGPGLASLLAPRDLHIRVLRNLCLSRAAPRYVPVGQSAARMYELVYVQTQLRRTTPTSIPLPVHSTSRNLTGSSLDNVCPQSKIDKLDLLRILCSIWKSSLKAFADPTMTYGHRESLGPENMVQTPAPRLVLVAVTSLHMHA